MPLRVTLRLVLLVAVTLPLYAGWVLTRPLAWIWPGANPALQRTFIGSWARATLRIMGVRARYEGAPPGGAYFLVANHLSYVDIPLLLARLDARFLAKSEIAGWPVMGLLARSTGTLFIDRTRKRDLTRAMGEIHGVLATGTGVIVFPEGTSTDGAAVQAFKPSLFEVPLEADLDVHCASIHYHSPGGPLPAWEAVCWWGDATFGGHFLRFLGQPRTEATVVFAATPTAAPEGDGAGCRKELAQGARRAVEGIFRPSRPAEAGPDAEQDGDPARVHAHVH